MTIEITDRCGEKPRFTQWEVNRELRIAGAAEQPQLRFACPALKRALVVVAEAGEGGVWTCKVPNFVLQFDGPLAVSVFEQTENGEGRETALLKSYVYPRLKPQDYTYEENIGYINWVQKSAEVQAFLDSFQTYRDEIEAQVAAARAAARDAKNVNPRLYYDTTANWDALDPVSERGALYLYSDARPGELGTARPGVKIGDGVTRVSELPFLQSGEGELDAYLNPADAEELILDGGDLNPRFVGLEVAASALAAGEAPTAALSGGDGTPYRIRFGIPAGARGAQGPAGPQGEKGEKGDTGAPGEVTRAELSTALGGLVWSLRLEIAVTISYGAWEHQVAYTIPQGYTLVGWSFSNDKDYIFHSAPGAVGASGATIFTLDTLNRNSYNAAWVLQITAVKTDSLTLTTQQLSPAPIHYPDEPGTSGTASLMSAAKTGLAAAAQTEDAEIVPQKVTLVPAERA